MTFRRLPQFLLTGGLVVLLGWGGWRLLRQEGAPPGPALFVGSESCASCHAVEAVAWEGSHHALAMQVADENSVLGDFDGATFSHSGTTSTFFRSDGRFMVRTDGPDGQLADFEVSYTFGLDPLQQYLVEFPDGRIQPLPIAWDSRRAVEGGQRWFHLYGEEEIRSTDELHWTGPQQNWNYMCADCHSTNVERGYDAATDRFQTTWSEINVSCEACHGPGSRHLEWAGSVGESDPKGRERDPGLSVNFIGRGEVQWGSHAESGAIERAGPDWNDNELQVCAQCHSQRAQIAEGYVAGSPLTDFYLPTLLGPGLYHADGQQLDEVYIYGSFLQSRMYAAGVTCSDCHDPHTAKLRTPGNQLCTGCHAPERYDTSAHHFHDEGGAGSECVSCHMPETTYMQVDPRRDHSLRIPRPDLSVELGVPDPCTTCHSERSPRWAAERIVEWYGGVREGFQRFARAFYRHNEGEPGSDSLLTVVAADPGQPEWIRASALMRLAGRPVTEIEEVVQFGVNSADPTTRRAALTVAESLPEAERSRVGIAMLADPSRIVRFQAAWVLAPLYPILATSEATDFRRVSEELVSSHRTFADRPESRVTLGSFFGRLGRSGEAEVEFLAALRLSPHSIPAYVNLADLYRVQGREVEAWEILRRGLEIQPDDPSLHHALGLAHARRGELAEAVAELARAAALDPESPRFAYAHAVALHSTGEPEAAIEILEGALERHPGDRDTLIALSTFHRDEGRMGEALRYAEELVRAYPWDPEAAGLAAALRGR